MSSELTILVIDDLYAKPANEFERPSVYSRERFTRMFSRNDVVFEMITAWDKGAQRYTVDEVRRRWAGLRREPDAVLLDIIFGSQGWLGLEILEYLCREFPHVPVVVMSTLDTADALDEAMALGAVDYVSKPFTSVALWQSMDRFLGAGIAHWLVGNDSYFLTCLDSVAAAAEGGRSSVLLLGESGTGKELFARYLHRHGPRRSRPFVAVDVHATPETLLEGTLFGHTRGAFTGADAERTGEFGRAHGGVLFLDEIGNTPISTQSKLLRALETREYMRIGEETVRTFDVQVVAATNSDLPRLVKDGKFRRDLYHRLAGVTVSLPASERRVGDLPQLIHHMVKRSIVERRIPGPAPLPRETTMRTSLTPMDGNVRALRQAVEHAFDCSRGRVPTPDELAIAIERAAGQLGFAAARESVLDQLSVEVIPASELGDLPDRIIALRVAEAVLLISALEATKSSSTGLWNRAAAAVLLLGKKRASTNAFDRRLRAVFGALPVGAKLALRERYPMLQSIPHLEG
jgi:DNA-binding NtrC family response regulator